MIRCKSYLDFIDIIKPYVIWDCFKYKIDLSNYKAFSFKNRKLNESDVIEIRRLYSIGLTQNEISNNYNVTQGTIGKIVRKERWKKVGEI